MHNTNTYNAKRYMHIFTETSSLCVYMLWKTLQKGQITYQSNVCFYRKKLNVNLEAKHRSWFDGPLKSMNQISNPACTLKCWIIYSRILSKAQNFQTMYQAFDALRMKSLKIQLQLFHGHLKVSCGIWYHVNIEIYLCFFEYFSSEIWLVFILCIMYSVIE